MKIRKKVLQVTALIAAAGVQAQNPIVQAIYTPIQRILSIIN